MLSLGQFSLKLIPYIFKLYSKVEEKKNLKSKKMFKLFFANISFSSRYIIKYGS